MDPRIKRTKQLLKDLQDAQRRGGDFGSNIEVLERNLTELEELETLNSGRRDGETEGE